MLPLAPRAMRVDVLSLELAYQRLLDDHLEQLVLIKVLFSADLLPFFLWGSDFWIPFPCQGPMEYNREVREYFEEMGVSVILLLRRNVLKRLISILANAYDRRVKPLNGTHKSHVHSVEEVSPPPLPPFSNFTQIDVSD